ncbi:hypothetical protein RCL1_008187 [Eukaryota sp. TZLM3-RCL]
MKWNQKTQNVVEPVYLKLRENLAIGRTMRVLECGNANQQVMEVRENSRILLINWDDKTCSCMETYHTGVPCKHLAAACIKKKHSPVSLVNPCFTIEKLRKTYELGLNVVEYNPEHEIVDVLVLPPEFTKKIGRRKKKRFRRRSYKRANKKQAGGDELDRMLAGQFEQSEDDLCDDIDWNYAEIEDHVLEIENMLLDDEDVEEGSMSPLDELIEY